MKAVLSFGWGYLSFCSLCYAMEYVYCVNFMLNDFTTLTSCMNNILDELLTYNDFSLVVRNPVFGVSDQVRHKPGCTATEDG